MVERGRIQEFLTLLCARALMSAAWRMMFCSTLLLTERNRPTSGERGLRFELTRESTRLSYSPRERPPEGDRYCSELNPDYDDGPVWRAYLQQRLRGGCARALRVCRYVEVHLGRACRETLEYRGESGNRFRLVCSKMSHHVLRRRACTVPFLFRRVCPSREDGHVVSSRAGRPLLQNDCRVGLVETGEVPEVRRLPKLVARARDVNSGYIRVLGVVHTIFLSNRKGVRKRADSHH